MNDIKSLLQNHDLHLLGIVESDLHGVNSRVKRSNPVNTKEILDNLHVDGYSIKLPSSWYSHGQARIILYVKEGINIKMRKLNNQDSDLPTLSCEIGLGREKKTVTNFFYREWTSGVTGLEDETSQIERQGRMIKHWKSLYSSSKDVLILGDANLCCFKWNNDAYPHKSLAEDLQDFLLQTSSFQVVKEYTRSEICSNGLTRSCIDHCYTDAPEKLSKVLVEPAGDSDHLAVIVTKFTKAPVTKPQTVRKRSYKHFSVGNFLTDIYNSGINERVIAENDIEEAAKVFQDIFSEVLDFHAPMKIFQMRKNYSPEISAETKLLINERNILQQEATATGSNLLLKQFKEKSKEVKKAQLDDKRNYLEKNLDDEVTVSTAWKTARRFLNIEKNLAPTNIITEEGPSTNPEKIASKFNELFRQKVKLLREKTSSNSPTIHPVQRLQKWIQKKGEIPLFKLKKINLVTLRKILKRMKGKRSHGVDLIDSFSIKLAGPLIEDALLHLINLSITEFKFAPNWKSMRQPASPCPSIS